MRQLMLYIVIAGIGLCMACSSPQGGGNPQTRDSIGDPIDPQDTTVDRLDPDSVTEDPNLQF